MSYILSIDQGTSGTKVIIVDPAGQVVARGAESLHTHYYGQGFVEQDPEAIYSSVLLAVEKSLKEFKWKGFDKKDISAIGISNQRETFLLWDKNGHPLCPAVVWQCKRSVSVCAELASRGLSQTIREKTGLVIDPYFSATKLIWLVRNNREVKSAVDNGEAYFGTVDSWLLYKLTQGASYHTDHTNASRTLFFNIHTLNWDHELLDMFGLSNLQLPEVKPAAGFFGETTMGGQLPEPVDVTAMIGDSHAAAFGAGCFDPGTAKATLGTGCSVLMNTGPVPAHSAHGMVTTICWSVPGRIDYALEGVIVTCGATIEWLKSGLQLLTDEKDTASMAMQVADSGGVYLVPAFSGLGSPHWQMKRKASLTGMSFATNKNHIVRAALESIPYQIKDVIGAMEQDTSLTLQQLMANGGMTSNEFVMQMLADITGKPVSKSEMPEVSALGAAYMAGLGSGIYKDIASLRNLQRNQRISEPVRDCSRVLEAYEGWIKTIKNIKEAL